MDGIRHPPAPGGSRRSRDPRRRGSNCPARAGACRCRRTFARRVICNVERPRRSAIGFYGFRLRRSPRRSNMSGAGSRFAPTIGDHHEPLIRFASSCPTQPRSVDAGRRRHRAAGERPDDSLGAERARPTTTASRTRRCRPSVRPPINGPRSCRSRTRPESTSRPSARPTGTPGWRWLRRSPRRPSIRRLPEAARQKMLAQMDAASQRTLQARLMIAAVLTPDQRQQLLTIEQQHRGKS